jgi:hypothetical protein
MKTKQAFFATGILAAVLAAAGWAATLRPTSQPDDTELLQVREQVWRAWFAGDIKALERLVPPDTIVMSGGEEQWKHQADVLRTSAEFHAKGGKLLELEFPRTEIQHYGDVASCGAATHWSWKQTAKNPAVPAALPKSSSRKTESEPIQAGTPTRRDKVGPGSPAVNDHGESGRRFSTGRLSG